MSDGDPASKVDTRPIEPLVLWISLASKTRETDELEDMGAVIAGPVLTSDIIKANEDFRGYRDIVEYFSREFNPAGDPQITTKIVQHVKEWLEIQLIEAVMTVRNLENGRTWDKITIEKALSEEALTAVMMPRLNVVEKVRRALGNELTKPSRAA